MKNQEYMANLAPEDFCFVMDWLMNDLGTMGLNGKWYTICVWLNSEAIVGRWQKVRGVMSGGGDPVYRCSCGYDEHVYGIEHPHRRPLCSHCGTFNMYS